MASARGTAAAVRLQATAVRLRELQQRIDRLTAGEPSTQDDVIRARAAAHAERLEYSRAWDRLVAAHESAANRHRAAAALFERAGRLQRADEHRAAAGSDSEAGSRLRLFEAAKTYEPYRPGRRGPGPAMIEEENEEERLRNAFVAIVGTRGVSGASLEPSRSRTLWRAVVDRCGEQHWRNWARAVCMVAVDALPSVRGTAVTAYDSTGTPEPMAASDGWARQVEEIHQLVGEGPAVSAQGTGLPVSVPSLSTEQARWPGYVGAAADTGLTGLWSFPLLVGGSVIGAITFYRSDEALPQAEEWTDAWLLAGVAAIVLWADADAIERGWDDDPEGYLRVHVAAGMISAQLAISTTEAMSRIRAHAFASGLSLGLVADAIVDRVLRLA